MDYTSPSSFFLNTYQLYHNINIIDDRKFVVLMVSNKLFFLLLMTIFFIEWFFQNHMRVIYNIHSSTNYTNIKENLIDEIVNYEIKITIKSNVLIIKTNFYN